MTVLVAAAEKAGVLWLVRSWPPEMQQDIFHREPEILDLTEEGFLPWFCSRTPLHPPLAAEVVAGLEQSWDVTVLSGLL